MEPKETAVARQWLGKHVPAATNTHETLEEVLEAVFSMGPVWYKIHTQYAEKEKYTISSSRNFLFFFCFFFFVKNFHNSYSPSGYGRASPCTFVRCPLHTQYAHPSVLKPSLCERVLYNPFTASLSYPRCSPCINCLMWERLL
jgi:hypothetical protein